MDTTFDPEEAAAVVAAARAAVRAGKPPPLSGGHTDAVREAVAHVEAQRAGRTDSVSPPLVTASAPVPAAPQAAAQPALHDWRAEHQARMAAMSEEERAAIRRNAAQLW